MGKVVSTSEALKKAVGFVALSGFADLGAPLVPRLLQREQLPNSSEIPEGFRDSWVVAFPRLGSDDVIDSPSELLVCVDVDDGSVKLLVSP